MICVKVSPPPLLPLGQRGLVKGSRCEIVKFQSYSTFIPLPPFEPNSDSSLINIYT